MANGRNRCHFSQDEDPFSHDQELSDHEPRFKQNLRRASASAVHARSAVPYSCPKRLQERLDVLSMGGRSVCRNQRSYADSSVLWLPEASGGASVGVACGGRGRMFESCRAHG
jgi:hypothetical protein